MIDPRTPVIVGVGQFTERLDAPDYRGLSSVELAVESARAALADAAGVDRLATQVDTVIALRTFEDSAPHYSTPFGKSDNYPHSVARRLGIAPTRAVWAAVGGDTPQTMVVEAMEDVAAGRSRMALITGAEAISTARHLAATQRQVDWSEHIDAPVDDRGPGLEKLFTRYTLQHRLASPPEAYAVFEHARRARLGLTREAYAAAMGALFEPFSRVAAVNPYSMAPAAFTAAELATVTDRNRLIADPYPRLLVARDQVNQSASLLIASVGVARELGIAQDKWVYLHGYAHVAERGLMDRADLGAAPGARLAVRAALDAAGTGLPAIDYIDLYSCFPIAVFNVCDGFGLAPDDPRGLTVTGGLPYFGGPGNTYSTHAIATLVEKLRARPGTRGLIGANGGFLSKYAAGVYSTLPVPFRACDCGALQAQVDAMPGPRTAHEAEGEATIETYTVSYGKSGAAFAIVVGRLLATGERFLANTAEGDAETLREMVERDPLGRRIHVRPSGAGNRFAFGAARPAGSA